MGTWIDDDHPAGRHASARSAATSCYAWRSIGDTSGNGDPESGSNSTTEGTAREDEACLARLGAAGVRLDIATMPVAAKAACTIDVPVRLKSVTTRARAAIEVHLPEEPVVSCAFAERLTSQGLCP
jgi:hypothetical protein